MSWQESFSKNQNAKKSSDVSIASAKLKAFESFLQNGLPSKNEESWRSTSLASFKNIDWQTAEEKDCQLTHEQMQSVSRNLPADFINFVFVNGVLDKTLSDNEEELIVTSELTEEHLRYSEHIESEKILNLATAFADKNIKIKLRKSKTLEQPVQLVFVQSSEKSTYISERLEIKLEENSEMALVINSLSFANQTADAINLNVNIDLANSARLKLVQLQNEDLESFHFSQTAIQLANGSQLVHLNLVLGNKITRNSLSLKFVGGQAEAEMYGVSVLDQDQHVDHFTEINHMMGHNRSVQHYKSIVSGKAHSVFRGLVSIDANAQKADSTQLNNNLLLTSTAHADSLPQLKIYADDVKASHGSTVGQLNKEEIFYFLSRGISQSEAVKLIAQGFAKELIFKINNEPLQRHLLQALNKKLENMVSHV